MSKTGEWIVGSIERIAAETGYPFRFLMVKYFAQIHALEAIGSDEDPLEVLAARAKEREFVLSDEDAEAKDISRKVGEVSVKINVDTSELDKVIPKLRRIGQMAERIRDRINDTEAESIKMREQPAITTIFNDMTGEISYVDPETAKIRKHNHDTLWAVLAGFAACGALVVVFGLIIIGILSYARG